MAGARPDAPASAPVPTGPALRGSALVLGLSWAMTGIVALGILFAVLASGGQDPAGQGMLTAFAALGAAYWLLAVLPAMRFARQGRRLKLSLGLLLGPPLFVFLAPLLPL